jgi:hypothetical protein
MNVPLWVLKASFRPYGSKMPERPVTLNPYAPVHGYGSVWHPESLCAQCALSIKGTDWVFRSGSYVHRLCETDFVNKSSIKLGPSTLESPRRSRRRAGFHKQSDEPDPIPDGNLGDSEYRFWIGTEQNPSMFAMCRACRCSVYGEKDRNEHKKDARYWVGSDACTQQLIEVYRRLLGKKECVICHKHTTWKKWGVPICGKECERAWKFSQVWHTAVKDTLDEVRRKLYAEVATNLKSGGSETSESMSILPPD